MTQPVGFSAVVSLGDALDVDFAELKSEMVKYMPLGLLVAVILLIQFEGACALGAGSLRHLPARSPWIRTCQRISHGGYRSFCPLGRLRNAWWVRFRVEP